MSSVIAIDFGNENLVISAPRKGGVDIINNQSSHRLTPSIVAFSDTRRYGGEFAKQQQMQNVKGTITNLKRLVGLKYDTEEREIVQKIVPFKLVKLEDGYIGVEVNYLDQLEVFRVEQCIALLMKEVFQIARLHNIKSSDCVVVVSPWWDEVQRRVIIDSAKIAGFNVLKLVNSTTAAAIVYSMYHRKKLPEKSDKAVPVAFVDFGDSTMNVAIVMLSQGTVEVKGFACNEHLGGSDFTTALVKMLLEKTKEKYKIDPSKNPRSMLRFTQAAEKLKKSLSINPIMPFDVQSCMNDIDINFMVKREDFEKAIHDLVAKIEEPILKALEIANVKKEDLFAIEVHGGASRVKAVKDKICSVFGKELTQSLNPDECFSLGAGFQAAILSPQFRVDLKVKDVAPHQINIEWIDDQGVKKTNELFKPFNVVPCTKIVPIKVKRTGFVRLFNDQTGELGHVNIETGTDEALLVKLKIRLSSDGIIQVLEATHQTTEEVIIKDQDQDEANLLSDAEHKKKVVTKDVHVLFNYKPHFGLSKDQIEKYQSEEKKMFRHDQEEIEIDNARNELESYIFSMNTYITRDFPEFFDPSKKDDYLQKIADAQCWFEENEFDRLPLNEYKKQLDSLKQFGEPAMARKNSRIEIPLQIQEFMNQAKNERMKLDNKEEKFNHITENERNAIKKDIDDYSQWLKNKLDEIEKIPKYVDVPFQRNDAQSKINSLEKKVHDLFMKPKITPLKKEEKNDEKPTAENVSPER